MSYVYILANRPYGVLYIGVTRNLIARMKQHRAQKIEGFTKNYNVNKLMYYETFQYIEDAIWREKNLKKWKRVWKLKLICEHNPQWKDLVSVSY